MGRDILPPYAHKYHFEKLLILFFLKSANILSPHVDLTIASSFQLPA